MLGNPRYCARERVDVPGLEECHFVRAEVRLECLEPSDYGRNLEADVFKELGRQGEAVKGCGPIRDHPTTCGCHTSQRLGMRNKGVGEIYTGGDAKLLRELFSGAECVALTED